MVEALFIDHVPASAAVGTYNIWLVGLSFLIAAAASFVAVNVVALYNQSHTLSRRRASLLGGFFLGGGIWSMHFTGMLAYEMDMVHDYSPLLTAVSLAIAVLFSWVAFEQILKPRLLKRAIMVSGLIVGMAVVVMHYLGMEAMQMQAQLRYIPSLFALSVIIAMAAATAAIIILRQFITRHRTSHALLASAVMGIAVCGMHYTGMEAAVFMPFADCRFDPDQDHKNLIIAVTLSTFFLIILPGFILSLNLLMLKSRGSGSQGKAARWHYVYYALAGFNLVTVAISLFLNHVIIQNHDTATHLDLDWKQQKAHIASLTRLAIEANNPNHAASGNQNTIRKKEEFSTQITSFNRLINSISLTLNAFPKTHFPDQNTTHREPLLVMLDASQQAFERFSQSAAVSAQHIRQGHYQNAHIHTAIKDQHFAELLHHLANAASVISTIQSKLLSQQLNDTSALRSTEYMIAAFVLILILATTFYGHRMANMIKREEELKRFQNKILDLISTVQAAYIARKDADRTKGPDRNLIFDFILSNILTLSASEYGFIGEILTEDDGTPYLKTYAISNIAWNDETRRFYETNTPDGLNFTNLDSLFGRTITTGEQVLTNDPASHPASSELPEGQPALNSYLGIPIHSGDGLVGMVGVANKKGGYTQDDIDHLRPVFSTIGTIIDAVREAREKEKVQQQLKLYESIVTNADDIILVTDADLENGPNVIYVNDAFERITGYQPDEIIGSTPRMLQGKDTNRQTLNQIKHALINKEIFTGEVLNYTKTKQPYWLRMTIVPVSNGAEDTECFVAIQSDITKLKDYESELRNHRDNLQSLVEERTADLREAKEKAEHAQMESDKANQLKSEFLANMSHELRTPMHAIIGTARQLIDRIESWDKERQVDRLGRITTSGERLAGLLNDLLDLSKLEAGAMEYFFENCSLLNITNNVLAELQELSQQKNITIALEDQTGDAILQADHNRIHQVIINLLSNAIKFSPEGATIAIVLTQEQDMLLLTVSDEGPGIPEDERNSIFDKFTQSRKTKTSAGGTGLGLAICREIVLAHEGRIWAEKRETQGTTFVLQLPLNGKRPETDLLEQSA